MYKACPNCGHWNSEWSDLPEQCVKCSDSLPKKTQAEIKLENCAKELEAIKAKYPEIMLCGNKNGDAVLTIHDQEQFKTIQKLLQP